MYTVGIDPGLTGAIAILRDGWFITLLDMPTTIKGGTGAVKYEVDPSGILRFLRDNLPAGEACKALIERVNSRPGQAASATFSMGDSFGTARAVLACAGMSYIDVTPAKWKKYFKLSTDKEQSRTLANKQNPNAELHLKKHHDRAEAILMAQYLWETEFK